MDKCPVCGNDTLVRESHCSTCIACGYSKCEDKDVKEDDITTIDLGDLLDA